MGSQGEEAMIGSGSWFFSFPFHFSCRFFKKLFFICQSINTGLGLKKREDKRVKEDGEPNSKEPKSRDVNC